MEATRSEEALVRVTAAYWMARTTEGEKRKLPIRTRLREMLSDPDANVRATATSALETVESQG